MAADNISKFYQAFNAKYDNFNSEQDFRNFLKGAKRENIDNLYNAFNSAYDNFGSADDMISYLGWSDSAEQKPAPSIDEVQGRKTFNVSRNPAMDEAYKAATQPAPAQEQQPQQPAATAPQEQRPAEPTPAPVAEEPEVNPFPYSGGLEQEAEDLRAQLAEIQVDEDFVSEYEARQAALEEQAKALKNLKGDIRNTGIDLDKYKADSAWLKENAERYESARGDKSRADEINAQLAEIQKAEEKRKNEEARRARDEKMRGQSENNAVRFGPGGFASYAKDMTASEVKNYFAADQLDAMSDQEYDKGSKFDSGYKDNPVGTAIKQFVAGGINNVDLGSLTAGLSEGTTFKAVRDVAEKNNGLINEAFKKLGYDDEAAGKIIADAEAAWEQLQPAYEEMNARVAELKDMEATLEALANSGDVDKYTAAYNNYKKKYDEYARRLKEYEPLQASVDKYTELMDAVQEATASGLTDGERDVLESFARYVRAQGLSSVTESTASKAGAGAEQSLEFMLDFIITKGLGKTGTKAASKIAANGFLKRTLGETGAKIAGRGLADMGTSAVRTALMFPRSLATYGEQITAMDGKESGVDEFGRHNFDRTRANAALNTALTQYIEYWSEGFGEYFGAAEQALFRSVTKNAPKIAVGQTLKNYRGSIGKYLDYGKFDGMFNEMLEEVVGSTFNALNGWLSGDRVGDSQAMKEFFAGDNLATLFFSFLPMSAIGAATNMKAYHRMKERYDNGVSILNPLLENGSISREELDALTSGISEMTPEQIRDKVVELTDNARKKNGGALPKDFTQGLMGYLEGSFSMGLQREAWEDSAETFAVANAYAAQYENPDARNAWDLAEQEQQARSAALAAGFTEEELDRDSSVLSRESTDLKETEPERAGILYNYSLAKAQSDGLKGGYDRESEEEFSRIENTLRGDEVNGNIIRAKDAAGNDVLITSQDATVDGGRLNTPTGEDGLVNYITPTGETAQAKAGTFTDVASTPTGEYVAAQRENFMNAREQFFDRMKNTVSPTGQARAISEKVGHNIVVSDGNGVVQPFKVERMTNGGSKVVISGDKKALQRIAEAMGMRVPTSGYLEPPVTSLYPLLAKEADGSLSSGLGEAPQQEAPAAPAQEAAPAAEQATDLSDLRDQNVQIVDEGQVKNVHVIDVSDGSVVFEELDENGDVMRTTRLPEIRFAFGMQGAANPAPAAAEETPAEEPAQAPVSTIPVDERTGEKLYEAPGVSVEDAIADLYATEGLTEADVDQYIAEQAAKAEAARNPGRGDMSPQAWGQAKQEAARVADFWSAVQRAAEQRKAQQQEAIEEAVEEATPVATEETPATQPQQRVAPAATPMTVDSRRKVVARLKNWSRRTGVKISIRRSVDEVQDETAKKALREGRVLTGWFNEKTGEVEVFLPNVMNTVEADKTFIHETVAHKGLRGLLGEEGYNDLCDRVWNELMTPEEQAEFMEYNRHLQGSEDYLRRAAADEYIARLSENLDMPDNRNIFERIVDWVMDLLGLGGNVSALEEDAEARVAGRAPITRSDLYDLLEDSLKRFEKGRNRLNTESLPAEIQNEMEAKGLVMDGGVVMDQQQDALKKAAEYQTPNELDAKSSPEVGHIRFSESTMPAWARNYMTYRDAKKHVVQVLENFTERIAADELVHNVVPQGVYKYGEKPSGSFAGPLRTNIEYVVTFDMDTSCPRSLQYLEYVKQIEAQIGRPLTQPEMIQLIEMLRVYGQMIPCVYCYCENKRQALKQYYHDFMNARRGVINAKTEEEALAAMYGHGTTKAARESKDPKVALNEAAYKVFQQWRNGKQNYNPTIKQLWFQYRNDRNVILTVLDDMLDSGRVNTMMTDETIAKYLNQNLRIEDKKAQKAAEEIVSEWKWNRIEDRPHEGFRRVEEEDDLVVGEETLALWREMTAYGKSASQAKNVMRYIPYTDELKTLSQEQKDYINGMGGLRMHSSNDFRIDYVLDYFQFMADMAVNHMLGHTYTKSPEFVRIFGNSGYKINMSIAAYEDSHGVRPNPEEGFDWTVARELREQFPNAGVMFMATSDAQVQLALDTDWIDMFIPFHASGLPKAVWYNMRHWTDYSSSQNERFLNGDEMREALAADGVGIPKKATAEEVERMYLEHFNIHVERYTSGRNKGKRIRPHFLPGKTVVDGVEIPGHNNDYETYINLCRTWGVRPRFYGLKVKDNTPEGGGREVDITEHPAYMKCIKETARTDTPQTEIVFNFDQPSEALGGRTPIEYAMEELENRARSESEAAKGPVRNIYESYKQDPYGVIPQFIDTIIKHKEETGEDYPLDYLTPDSRKWFMTERRALQDAYKDVDTIPYHPHEYDENGNLIMAPETPDTPEGGPAEPTDEGGTRFRVVTRPGTIKRLEDGPKVKVYRSMQFVPDPRGDVEYDLGDGNGLQKGFLYAPMSAKVDGKWRDPIRLGLWEEAEENPGMANEDGEFLLDKGDGSGPMWVAYAPYLHTRRSPLNEQFSSAYKRGNLVIVESEIPESELSSNYTADRSKKSTGEHDWPSGKVSNALAKKGMDTRKVILSRWAKPVRLVPNSEVADEITRLLGNSKLSFPYNVVTPGLRAELVKRGVKFSGWQGNKPKDVDELIAGMKAENERIASGNIRFREANRNQLGFVSNAEASLDRIKMDKATPEQWAKMIEKEGGMKAGEDKWLGLSDWLKGLDRKTVTKDEIADYIAENQIVIEEQDYAENIDLTKAAQDNVRDTIGRGKELEELQSEIDELIASEEYRNLPDDEAKDDWLLDQMKERYGDDFELGYFIDEDQKIDYNIEPWDIDEESINESLGVRKINQTRLMYTTDGLENKREIALVVPNIEPWNQGDPIHFGDAGEGRAVAWVRFGETTTYNPEAPAAQEAHNAARKDLDEYRDKLKAKYADSDQPYFKACTPEELAELASLKDREVERYDELQALLENRPRILVIDEIQSKRHQEAREQGGYRDDTLVKKARERAEAAKAEYDRYTQSLIDKYGGFNEMHDRLTPEENAESQRLYMAFRDANQVVARKGFDPNEDEEYRRLRAEQQAHENSPEFQQLMKDWAAAVKAGDADRTAEIQLQLNPYQLENQRLIHKIEDREVELADEFNETHWSKVAAAPFEKNWHELAMKRMLRLAAEEGYDYVAWTTGDQQAERYNIGGIVDKIDIKPGNKEGVKDVSVTMKTGPDMGFDVDENGKVLAATDPAFVGGKNLSDYLGKELSVKVLSSDPGTTIDGDNLRVGGEGMKGFYDDILPRFMNKYGKKWGVKVSDITLPNVEQAAQTMHAVPVTQEMKESVLQGQTMFRDASADREAAVQSERADEKTHDWLANSGLRLIKRNIENGVQLSRQSPGLTLRLGLPSGSLLAAGVRDQRMVMSEYDLAEASGNGYGDKHSYHPFDLDDLKDLASLINHPVAIFRDKKNPYNRVLLLNKKGYLADRKETGKHDYVAVIASVPIRDENGNRAYENRILTIFPAENRWKDFYSLLRDVSRGLANPGQEVMWADNKKISSWVKGHATSVRDYDTITQEDITNIRNIFDNKQDLLRDEAKNLRTGENTRFRERVTPEQDKEYMDAVNAGDMEKAQRMVDEAAAAAGYTIRAYHGTKTEDGEVPFSIIESGHFTDDRDFADYYANAGSGEGYVFDTFLKMGNPYVYDFKGQNSDDAVDEDGNRISTRSVYNRAVTEGHDGVILRNVDEYGGGIEEQDGEYPGSVTDYIPASANQVKSADPVTYDDNGNVIPLSERFNPENNDIRFRETPVDARSAQAGYEEEIQKATTAWRLEWQDQDIPVRIAMNQVMNKVDMKDLPEDADYLTRHNLVSSRADAQMHNYKLFYFEPMMDTIGRIEDILVGGKPTVLDRLTGRREKRLDAYGEIVDYSYAVSGLERNAWKRAEAKANKEKELERLAEKWEKESEAINADSRLSTEEKSAALDRAEKRYRKEQDKIEEKYVDRDYSGITALMGRPKEEWQEAEADARAMIADFQQKVNNDDLLNEMWDRIRACTDFNLEHAYKFGLLSRAEYERLHGTESQPRMWEYYLPLRGFSERTAEDEYTYAMFTSDSAGGDIMKKAKGRTTRADDPFAVMRHLSELEIVQGLNNWAKQALYNFVLNAGENSLLTQVEPWYVKEPGTDNWSVAEPNDGESLEAFETRMQEAYEDGDARRGRNGLKLGHIMANKMHRNQHMIRLKINGAEKMIWVNGSPVLAQSVNGVTGWKSRIIDGLRAVNRTLSQFYTTYSLNFLTKNMLRDTQFSRIAALVDESQPYLRQLEKNWWANNGYVSFGYPMMKLVAAWESGELEKKQNRTEREQMFIDFMYDGGATGYTMINSMDKIKRELERMVKNAGHGERNIPVIDWYAKGVGALNEASELLTRFTFYQTSRMMGRSRERSAFDAKESSVNFNRRGLRSGNGVAGWTAAAASALYLFMNPAIQGLEKFVRLHKAHPWRMGLVDATYFMMGFVNSLLNAMIAGSSDGDGDDDEKMGPDWYWNIPEWVRRSNMIIGSPFKKLGKWGYLVIALPVEYKGFYAMGELASALVQGKYAAKDAPTIANEVIGVVSELLPVNPVEGFTPGDNPAMSIVRNMTPGALAPIMDVATNRSFAGIPLWKENIYDEAQPLSQSAFASTPEILNKAVIKLSEVTSDKPWHVDIPAGAIRGLLKGYGGGAYTFVENTAKFIFADEAHPRRYEQLPFVSGFTGYLDEDRRDTFNSNALQRYKELSEDVVKRIRSAAPGEDIKAKDVYDNPDNLPKSARVTRLLHSDEWILGEMYYHGMLKAGDDVKRLRTAWKKAKDEYLELTKDKNATADQLDAAEKRAQQAWLEFTLNEGSLVDRLMEEEYNHARQKVQNGIPYERKETLGEKAYNLTNKK